MTIRPLQQEINRLASRLAKYQRESRGRIVPQEQSDVRFNQLTAAILDLIRVIRKSFEKEASNNQIIFAYLKKRYENRLKQKLANRQPINLRKSPTTVGTSGETSAAFVPIAPGEIQAEIKQTFQDAYGPLIDCGGAGLWKDLLIATARA